MDPEVDRALVAGVALASVGIGLGVTVLAFRVADWAVERAVGFGAWLRFQTAPLCLDCGGRGWRRWREGDGAPAKGWTDCRLCRGLGRIVEDDR